MTFEAGFSNTAPFVGAILPQVFAIETKHGYKTRGVDVFTSAKLQL